MDASSFMQQTSTPASGDPLGGILALMSNTAHQVNKDTAEEKLVDTGILIDGEHVLLAFKVGQDMKLLTTHRVIFVDVQGVGRKVAYFSIPYEHIVAFSLETAGTMDTDSELRLWTDISPEWIAPPKAKTLYAHACYTPMTKVCNLQRNWAPRRPGKAYMKVDLLKGFADVFAIQQLLSEKVLLAPSGGMSLAQMSSEQDVQGPIAAMLALLGGDAKNVNTKDVQSQLRRVLLHDEQIEMAFKTVRDLTVLTTKRLLVVDKQGVFGESVEYKTIPYSSIRTYVVRTAGFFDTDAEMEFHTTLTWPMTSSDVPGDPDDPAAAKFQLGFASHLTVSEDLRKKDVDLGAISAVLSSHLWAAATSSSLVQEKADEGSSWWLFKNGHKEVNESKAEDELGKHIQLLAPSEHIVKSFEVGRDSLYLTPYRLIVKDVQGVTGKKIEYTSIPYSSVKGYNMRAGGFLLSTDQDWYIETDSWAMPVIRKDFGKTGGNLRKCLQVIEDATGH